jgi:multidrug resistance efflux pump
MTVNRTQDTTPPKMTASELIDRLGRFDGPPEQFIVNLLAVQCHLAPARGGTILRPSREGGIEMVATYPPLDEGQAAPVWLATAAEAAPKVIQEGQTSVRPVHDQDDLYGQAAKRNLVMIPLRGGAGVRGTAAFYMETSDRASLERAAERLELTVSLLSLYEMRLTLQHRQMDLQRLRQAMETLAAVNDHSKFTGAAMAFCNEIASRWKCDRVSLGFLKGRYVKLKAMNDVEKFDRKTEPVQKVESAMEECFDQDVEIVYPAANEATYVARSHKELSQRFGPSSVLSLPLRQEEETVGVVTIERSADEPYELTEAEAMRLTCDLCTARLAGLYESDRWFGARAANAVRKAMGAVVGPKHTWIKLLSIGILALILFLVFAKGQYDVQGPMVIEAEQRRTIAAPFNGVIEKVHAKPNQPVKAGDVLAELRTQELVFKRDQALIEKAGYLKQAEAARRQRKTAEAQIYENEARKIDVQVAEFNWLIDQAKLTAPFDARVLRGDLERQLYGPVEKGDPLFEVAPLDTLYAEISVSESEVADILAAEGTVTGELATNTYPDRRIPFQVVRINPVAEVDEQDNIFKVRVKLLEQPEGLHPGMEGVAHVEIGKRHYAWIWTRKLINWVRMRLWI